MEVEYENNVSILDLEFGRGNVGIIGTCFNIFKCFIGIGILALPHAFLDVGILGGILGILIIGSLNYYTMMLQVFSKKKLQIGETYSDLGFLVFGSIGKFLIDWCLYTS